jgi:hypothetical protein
MAARRGDTIASEAFINRLKETLLLEGTIAFNPLYITARLVYLN